MAITSQPVKKAKAVESGAAEKAAPSPAFMSWADAKPYLDAGVGTCVELKQDGSILYKETPAELNKLLEDKKNEKHA